MSTRKPPVPEASLTIKEFCHLERISRPTYYKLQRQGRGPAEMRFGTAVRISPEARAEWHTARANPVGDEAREIADTKTIVVAQRRHAAQAGKLARQKKAAY